jgi:cystathionine beta-lyase/cystathionine gamma-synthase
MEISSDSPQEPDDSTNVLYEFNGETWYNRCTTTSTNYMNLTRAISDLYGNRGKCLLTASGMSAINVVLQTLTNEFNVDNIVYGNELYCDTSSVIHRLKIPHHPISVTDSQGIITLFETKLMHGTNILFVESCSNPNSQMFDMTIIPRLSELSKRLFIVVDNTWLSPILYNPFTTVRQEVANNMIVIESLTKFYSAGSHIGGMIITPTKRMYTMMHRHIKNNGLHVSPLACREILSYMHDMSWRVRTASSITCSVVGKLQKYLDDTEANHENKLIAITHSSLNSHQCHDMARNIMTSHPSLFVLQIKSSKVDLIQRIRESGISYRTSYGGKESRICNWPIIDGPYTRIRVSVGYADTCDALYDKLLTLF